MTTGLKELRTRGFVRLVLVFAAADILASLVPRAARVPVDYVDGWGVGPGPLGLVYIPGGFGGNLSPSVHGGIIQLGGMLAYVLSLAFMALAMVWLERRSEPLTKR